MDLENEMNIFIWTLKEDCKLYRGVEKDLHSPNESLKEQQWLKKWKTGGKQGYRQGLQQMGLVVFKQDK